MYRLFQHLPQQPPPQPPPPPAIQPPRRYMWVRPWIMQMEDKRAYHNWAYQLNELYNTDIPGFTNFMRMTLEFFEMIKARAELHLVKQATNYRAALSVGMKLAITLRYLATEESYTSLSYQFMVERSSISKFVPKACRAIQEKFKGEYLRCPSTPDDWKNLEQEFRFRWNVSHAVGSSR